MTLTNTEKKRLIVAAAVLLIICIIWRWWSSGDIDAIADIKNTSATMTKDIKDITREAKKREEDARAQTTQEIQALHTDDIALSLETLLRKFRSGS